MQIDKLIKKEIISLAISVIIILCMFLTVSFASFFSVAKGEDYVIKMGDLSFMFCKDTSCSSAYSNFGQTIGLTKDEDNNTTYAQVMPYDTTEEAVSETPYIFNLKNTGSLDLYLSVYLENHSNPALANEYQNYSSLTDTYPDHIKIGVSNCTNGINREEVSVLKYSSLVNNRIITDEKLSVNSSITYCVWIWLDETTPNDAIETYFISDINATAEYKPSAPSLTSVCENNNNLTTCMINNVEKIDAFNKVEDDYRYQGSNPSNYALYNNELYRIVGIFNNGETNNIKLVKEISAETSLFSENGTSFDTSKIYDMFNSIYESNYENTCTVKTVDFDKTLDELANSYSYTGFVGLLDISDYYYANDKCNNGYTINEYNEYGCYHNNYLNIGSDYYLINASNDKIVYINDRGVISTTEASTKFKYRIVIYLNNDVKLISGSGTYEEPYVIE